MNSVLHHLRRTRLLAAMLLAWFVLFVGAAAAAPLMKAGPTAALCSASGLVKNIGGLDGEVKDQHSIDCVLCCFTAEVPASTVAWEPPVQPLGHVLQSIPAARIAAITAAPLPPRGPPHHS